MSERKVINKYYPPNYNPLEAEEAARKLSKKLKTMNKDSVTIRLMTPFSMRCLKCSEFIPKSRKFNGKKELLAERYLETIKQYRLSIKCPRCNNMISFRTDPKSGDYVMEVGGVKNFVTESTKFESGKNETLDETLQRLERQQQQENDEVKKDPREDKLEQIEKRLAKMQQEQEDYENLESLRRGNIAKMKRAAALRENLRLADEEKNTGDAKRAEEAFQKYRDASAVGFNVLEPSQPEASAPLAATTIPQKIRMKKKTKSNSLGIVRKNKS
ncbi:LANO_0D06194g1_1 [Lachancea nothofagi CBS 11611]|uniref:LANO_0D06194g1_1 n=1 Tax=Lachancea nothofagi CBS 11611 TaxID=1266666 RepID=A0A1G4JHD6_9SACH|nr:LANO_0D06194g1_1 [Lachancea nothofagi CBS 11611]